MADPIRPETYPHAEAQKMRRRRRALGLALVVAALGLLVWARIGQMAGGQDAAAQAAAQALARAVAGEPAAFDAAREGFRRASGGMIVDAYPVFALTVVEQLASGEVTLPDRALAEVIGLVGEGDLAAARARAVALEDALSRAWANRLLDDMGAPGASPP